MYIFKKLLIISLILFSIFRCSSPNEPGKDSYSPKTPLPDKDAELIALYLSGEMYAPYMLYRKVSRELKTIRTVYGKDNDFIRSVTFTPPWTVSHIVIKFDSSTAKRVEAGEYHDWDALNEKYDVDSIEKFDLLEDLWMLYFKGRLHPERLAAPYRKLPGVIIANASYLGQDFFSNIFPRQTEKGITYLYRRSWGDCPSGCLWHEYWYFIFRNNFAIFVGHRESWDDSEPPEWWEEAKYNIWDWLPWG